MININNKVLINNNYKHYKNYIYKNMIIIYNNLNIKPNVLFVQKKLNKNNKYMFYPVNIYFMNNVYPNGQPLNKNAQLVNKKLKFDY